MLCKMVINRSPSTRKQTKYQELRELLKKNCGIVPGPAAALAAYAAAAAVVVCDVIAVAGVGWREGADGADPEKCRGKRTLA